jgi:small subunit ribosomal protein S7
MRRRAAEKRPVTPDPKFGDDMVARFINVVMLSGKKSLAERIVYGALDELSKKQRSGDSDGGEGGDSGNAGTVILFNRVLDQVCPTVEVRSRRVGGATYQIPIEVAPHRRLALGMRWIIQSARNRSEKGMMRRLAAEMVDALAGRGEAVKKREDVHRMAKANQAFAHYRWN